MATKRHGAPLETRGRERTKQDKRDRIRRAAWELFASAGFDETTTRAVSRRAGVAAGTLFLYAPDKTDLLFLVFHDRLSAAADAALASVPRKAALVDQLTHVFERLFAMYGEHPALAKQFVAALPGGSGPNAEQVNALTAAFLHRLATLIAAAAARGEVDRAIAPLQAAGAAFALYFATLMAWISGMTNEAGLAPMMRASLELLMRGLAPRAPLSPRRAR